LERGDVVVIASRQPDMPGREGIPAVDIDLAQRVYDMSVCGIVNDLYAEHQPDPEDKVEANQRGEAAPGKSGRGRSRPEAAAAPGFHL
jgi:hypothetical protein